MTFEVPAVDLDQFTGPNPLFEAWRSANPDGAYDWMYSPRFDAHNSTRSMFLRSAVTGRWAWAVPGPDTLDLIAAEAGPHGIVEVGAGVGYWAAQLARLGVDVIASDLGGDRLDHFFPKRREQFHPVVEADAAEFAALHAHRTLLLVWPPYDAPMGADAIEAYWQAGGRRVLFVGEGEGGCTGDDRLYALLGDFYDPENAPAAARFDIRAVVDIPQWYGIHDRLYVADRIDHPALTTGEPR